MTLLSEAINITDYMSPVWALVGNFVDNLDKILILVVVGLVIVFYKKFIHAIAGYISGTTLKGKTE